MRTFVLIAVICMMTATSYADPGPPFASTIALGGLFSVVVTPLGGDGYQWDITLNAVTGYYGNPIQDAQAFLVYSGDDGTNIGSELGWTFSNSAAPSAEWKKTASDPYLLPGAANSKWFKATIPNMGDPSLVALHVRETDGTTYFANNTPELSTGALLLLSLAPVGVAWRRRRRK